MLESSGIVGFELETVDFKKCTMWKLQVKFNRGKMRTITQKTTSQIVWETTPRRQGEGLYICDFGEEDFMQSNTYFLQKVSAKSHEGYC